MKESAEVGVRRQFINYVEPSVQEDHSWKGKHAECSKRPFTKQDMANVQGDHSQKQK
jgi:hypothetical protein